MELTKTYAFNNDVETALRILTLLNAGSPESFDLDKLIYFDYLTVHSGDISEGVESLHVAVPNRDGELFVRRKIINEGLELLCRKGLVEKLFTKNEGIEYVATEMSSPFLDSLGEKYTLILNERASWTVQNFKDFSLPELKKKIVKDTNI